MAIPREKQQKPITLKTQYQSTPEAQELTRATLAGDYLSEENPYLQQVIDSTSRDVTQATQGQMANLAGASLRPGMMGSSVWQNQRNQLQDAMAKRLADSSGALRMQGYESERGRQNEVLGMQNQRDVASWANDRALQEAQAQEAAANAQRASAMAAGAGAREEARLAAQAQEAQIRANMILGQSRLAEEGRQFDAMLPLQWGGLLGGQINSYGQQNQGDLAGLGALMGQQMGAQQSAAGLGAQLGLGAGNLDLQGQGQGLQAAGMMPTYDQAGMAPMGMAGDYLSSLFSTQGGIDAARMSANASRYATSTQDQLARDQLAYQSSLNQWNYNNPQNALNDYTGSMMGFGNLAGEHSFGGGIGAPSSGAVVPGQDKGYDEMIQLGLGIAMMMGY